MIDLAQIPDNGHHILSPSGHSGWAYCTGQMLGLAEARARSTDNIASVEGTTGHFLLEITLILRQSPLHIGWHSFNAAVVPEIKALMRDAEAWAKGIENNRHNTEEVKAFARECYEQITSLNFTQEMRVEIDKCWQRIRAYLADGWELWPEAKVSLEKLFGHKHCDGTCDVLLFKKGRLLVVDLKYGIGIEVSPVENGQLSLYAGGAINHVHPRIVTSVELVIMQPRINNGVWKSWPVPEGYLMSFLNDTKIKARAALTALTGGPVEFNPSLSACQWCHRKSNCKARGEKAVSDTHAAFAAATMGENAMTYDTTIIDNQALAEILEKAPLALSFFNDMAVEAQKRATAGQIIPGRKLVQGRSKREWRNEEKLIAQLTDFGLSFGAMFNIKTKSPAQMDKTNLNDEQRAFCETATLRSHGAPSLTLESDSRPAVITNSVQAFDVVVEAESK